MEARPTGPTLVGEGIGEPRPWSPAVIAQRARAGGTNPKRRRFSRCPMGRGTVSTSPTSKSPMGRDPVTAPEKERVLAASRENATHPSALGGASTGVRGRAGDVAASVLEARPTGPTLVGEGIGKPRPVGQTRKGDSSRVVPWDAEPSARHLPAKVPWDATRLRHPKRRQFSRCPRERDSSGHSWRRVPRDRRWWVKASENRVPWDKPENATVFALGLEARPAGLSR